MVRRNYDTSPDPQYCRIVHDWPLVYTIGPQLICCQDLQDYYLYHGTCKPTRKFFFLAMTIPSLVKAKPSNWPS